MKKIYLVTGYLGAGKTSFLKNILTNIHEKVGVLVNEFGKISIDGIRLDNNNSSIIELNNGSIFCSCLKDDFISAMVTLLNSDINSLYIESSGLSDPSNIISIIDIVANETKEAFEYRGSICIIDGMYFLDTVDKMVNIERQIVHSNIIIINKQDKITSQKQDKIKEKIKEFNENAKIIVTEYAKIDISEIGKPYSHLSPDITTNKKENRPFTISIKITDEISPDSVEKFVLSVHKYFYRSKGHFVYQKEFYSMDSVSSNIRIRKVDRCPKEFNMIFISSVGASSLPKLYAAADKYIKGCYSA